MPPKGRAKAKPGAVAALAQKRVREIEEQQRAEREAEERAQKEAEEKRRIEEEARLIAEANEEKKRKERLEKREQQRKEGRLLTAAQKDRLKKAETARQALLESGVAIPGLACVKETGPLGPDGKPIRKSHAVDDRKKKKKPVQQEVIQQEPAESESPSPLPPIEVEVEDLDWEAAAERVLDRSQAALSPVTEDKAVDYHPASRAAVSAHPPAMAGLPGEIVPPSAAKGPSTSATGPSAAATPSVAATEPSAAAIERCAVATEPSAAGTEKSDTNKALRSPICCILGHVDTGKTKLLDKIRRTNVQGGEAGGITQQIGATFFPGDALETQCSKVDPGFEMHVPGLLIIDTPGHESFNNLRARGSSLCDIAILVVDIMHGLEPQTRESIGLLRARKCPFIIALNKIDRLYGWATAEWRPARKALEQQNSGVNDEFERRAGEALLQMSEEGLNCDLWWRIDDVRRTVSVAPTSAITGDGVPDLLYLLVKLTQSVITRALEFREEFQCTILEVKVIEGLGTTIDVVLVNGTLHENDRLVVCGMNGAIVSTVRALLTPQPLKELRVKGEYVRHKTIHAAMGVKIAANGLEEAVAGTSVFVASPEMDEDDLDDLKEDVMADMTNIFKSVDRTGEGVYVMASTLGSLEALLQFLKDSDIPVFAVNIGTVHKLDVKKASVMKDKEKPELCTILAFDVKVDPDAQKEADSLGVKIFTADIIYHLFDAFTNYVQEQKAAKKLKKKDLAVFPCVLTILPNCVFNKKDPLVLGVHIDEGHLIHGTPLCVYVGKEILFLGRCVSLEHNKKPVDSAKKGDDVAIKIAGDSSITFGRHFEITHKIYSRLTRESINCLKELFMEEMTKEDWKLIVRLKKLFSIT